MSEEVNIIDKYIECFDDCRPIVYKGVTISPFLVKDIRLCNYACYCLTVDPIELKDISLISLKRLDFILTVIERCLKNQTPKDSDLLSKFHMVAQSFQILLKYVFKGYTFDFSDPSSPNKKLVLKTIDKKNNKYQLLNDDDFENIKSIILNMKDFDNIRYLVLEHNGIDYSLEKYPPKIRERLKLDLLKQQNRNKSKAPTIEKLIDGAFLYTHLPYEYLLNLPVRKFYNLIDNIKGQEKYQSLMTGNFIVSNDDKHWHWHWLSGGYEKDVYKGLMSNTDDTEQKFNKINS